MASARKGRRGVVAASAGATLGALIGGLAGWAAVVVLELRPCDRGGYSCGGLRDAFVILKGMSLAGYAGALLGMGLLLRLLHHRYVGSTVTLFSLVLLLGIAAWRGLLGLVPNGVDGYVFFSPPFVLPFIAAMTRGVVVLVTSGARS